MSTRQPARQPAGRPTGGQFAQETRPGAAISLGAAKSLGASEHEVHEHVTAQAQRSGWVLAGEQITRLQADGHISSQAAMSTTSAHMTILGEDVVAPAVDDIEDTLAEWMKADDRPHGEHGRLDAARLTRACDEAGIPRDVIGYLETVQDRERVPTQFLSNLTASELAELHEQFVGPAGEQIAAELNHRSSRTWQEAAAATAA
ncbi:hypothetical protein GCG21_08915 [Pseudactinotalea sp. HY160]|uniref:hypothetical protein n=1 Tax=Pseudactinotalea sp. HY160 TaxID=2654490 RepID=UPI00128D0859|nr:hypothetical protein [Pseudactinotalea sp. HY160]MPV50125.1 hypothetical protein [Pseudactinotalea sp. HY160]